MKRLRVFIAISLLLTTVDAVACFFTQAPSVRNMIYRLEEDVWPYYPANSACSISRKLKLESREANIDLWYSQLQSKISRKKLEWYVYEVSVEELYRRHADAVKIFGADGYRLLCIAKECSAFRDYINDPWYYPLKNDPKMSKIIKFVDEAKAYRGRLATRYALQTVRMMVALDRLDDAMKYWEAYACHLPSDVIKDMAERHVAYAYRWTGNWDTAKEIYGRHGDIESLVQCTWDRHEIWSLVYRHCPDSPYFLYELQAYLTKIDNDYSLDEEEINDLEWKLDFADKVIKERRVKNLPMWHYAKAAMLDATGRYAEALSAVKAGEKACQPGTFLAKSMHVLRIKVEAETSRCDARFMAHLADEMRWIMDNGQKDIKASDRKKYVRKKMFGGWYEDIYFTNKYYWADVLNRILVDVVAPRLMATGRTVDAMLCNNLGVFGMLTMVYGKAESPNDPSRYSLTNITNDVTAMADTCKVSDIVKMYVHLRQPSRGLDSLVARYGRADRSYWCDIIGTRLIAEKKYEEAARWLKGVSYGYQRRLSTWAYMDRDPFCMLIGWTNKKRHHQHDRADYKLRYAVEMARLQHVMQHASSADQRGEAMIRYGVGLRNQKEWCWALSRYSDTSDCYYATKKDPERYETFIDISDSKRMIDKGIATISNRNLRAYYLHLFVRNKEVMDMYADTKTAQELRAHCDMWRDYAHRH